MNPLKIFCLVACLLAAVSASPNQKQHQRSNSGSLKPSDWVSYSEVNALPAVDQINLQSLENMSVEKGAKLIEQYYHLFQIRPNQIHQSDEANQYVPSPSQIPTVIVKPDGQKVSMNLNQLVAKAQQQPNFGKQELTILITGLPQQSRTVTKANNKLVEAYLQRYNQQQNQNSESSEENTRDSAWSNSGTLVIIDVGATITNFEDLARLNIQETGKMIANILIQLINKTEVPQEIIHVVAQGVCAHVAGAAGREYTRRTGQKLRRITALDPSKIFSKPAQTLVALARGDAEFIDAIHTSAYGMGTPMRVGDVDFYPNGPSAGVPGADNVVEASMRATRYFAESVRPGNQRNFPAVAARSLKQYQDKNGHGPRAFMGIDASFDLKGDYILEVNRNSPFGKSEPAQRQNSYHGVHQSWKNSNNQDYE